MACDGRRIIRRSWRNNSRPANETRASSFQRFSEEPKTTTLSESLWLSELFEILAAKRSHDGLLFTTPGESHSYEAPSHTPPDGRSPEDKLAF
eukprot:1178535-Prorocentrum_minimum.AAC.1